MIPGTRPVPVYLIQEDVDQLEAYPFSRHGVTIAAIRAGLAVLGGDPKKVLEWNPKCQPKRRPHTKK